MEFWTSVRVIVRRWYLVIPCLFLTGVVGLYLAKHVKPTYQASGSVLLAGSGHPARPETTSTVAGVNPYANMDQSQLAFLVSQSAGSTAFQEQMTQAGAIGTYSVTAIPGEPAMTVTHVGGHARAGHELVPQAGQPARQPDRRSSSGPSVPRPTRWWGCSTGPARPVPCR